MILKDLNKLGLQSQDSYFKYQNEEISLSPEFKKEYTKAYYADSREKISFAQYTTIVNTSGGLTITFPNQWYFIASYFTVFLNALKEYKNTFIDVFRGSGDIQKITSEIKNTGNIPSPIISRIESVLSDKEDIEYFKKFLSDYQWWFGSKTIDRADYFVSPILRLAKVVNVTQSYIADLALNLAEKPILLELLEKSNKSKLLPKEETEISSTQFDLKYFIRNIEDSGLIYDPTLLSRFVSSLITKPFLILTGLSGSGKTKLAQAFVQWICRDENQYCIVPVGADWTNREPLLGYPNALNPKEYVKPDSDALDLIIRANNQPDFPHFLILDEMNLSHVERYFADFLSVMESKEKIPLHSGAIDNGVLAKLEVPSNLFIIGTVNIDETTNMFSPKVLDRANTIEFRVSDTEMEDFLKNIGEINMEVLIAAGSNMAKSFLDMARKKSSSIEEAEAKVINEALVRFFSELKKTGAEFGYRTATEILRLIDNLSELDNDLSTNQKLDIAIMQKLLPKLHGSRRKLSPVLLTLASFCVKDVANIEKEIIDNDTFSFEGESVLYPLSLEKIKRMYKGAVDNGFASFAEA